MIIEEVFGDNGLASKLFPNYQKRPQQIEVSKAIHRNMQTRGTVIAEAGCGVYGKTLGYLI